MQSFPLILNRIEIVSHTFLRVSRTKAGLSAAAAATAAAVCLSGLALGLLATMVVVRAWAVGESDSATAADDERARV